MALTQAEQLELKSLEKELSGQTQPGLTPAEQSELAQLEQEFGNKQQATPNISQAESIGRGAYQGATLGFGENLRGMAEQGYNAVHGLFGNSVTDVNQQLANQGFKGDIGPTSGAQLYEQSKLQDRSANEAAQKANPWSYGVSNVAGSFVPNIIVPGISAAKGASVTNAALKSGGLGYLMGLGYGNKDLNTREAHTGAIPGAIISGLIGGVGQKIANKASNITPENLSKDAEIYSAQAQGLERGTRKKLSQGDLLNEQKVRNIGRQGLDEEIVTIGASAKDMVERNQALKNRVMQSRAQDYNKIDELGASQFNPVEAAIKTEDKIIGGLNKSYDDTQELIKALDPKLSNILSRGSDNISMKEAQDLVSKLGNKAKFDNTRSNEANQLAKDVYHSVRDYINESAGKAGEKIGLPGLKESINKANKQYSIAKDTDLILGNKLAREANKKVSLTDWIAISGQNPLLYFPKKILEEYGDKAAAIGLDKAAKLISNNPKAFGVFRNGLERAARKSPQAFNALHTRLMNENAQYRNKINRSE